MGALPPDLVHRIQLASLSRDGVGVPPRALAAPLDVVRAASTLTSRFPRQPGSQVRALHAWVWKENPSGMFADWNPKASCDTAS